LGSLAFALCQSGRKSIIIEKNLYLCTNETSKPLKTMKKLVLALSIFTLALSLSSCDLLGGLKEKFISDSTSKEQPQEVAETPAPAPTPAPKEVRIYANAYDGFVNVRAQPSAKSAKLGRLNNGNDYLVKLGVQGKWTIVKWQNGIGYVNSTIVGYTPWKPVYLNVDADWIQGIYTTGYTCYLIFNNGKYSHEHQYGDMEYGTWRFEGNEIVFTTKYVTEHGKSFDYYIGKETREPVDVAGKKIGELPKCPYMTPAEFAEYMAGECTTDAGSYSKEVFNEAKKAVNKLVRLK
jgi:hypothetical protein